MEDCDFLEYVRRYNNYFVLFLPYTNSHFIREGVIAILRAPVQPAQARVDPRDGRGGLVA